MSATAFWVLAVDLLFLAGSLAALVIQIKRIAVARWSEFMDECAIETR